MIRDCAHVAAIRILIAAIGLQITGCAVYRAAVYRVVTTDSGALMIPPGAPHAGSDHSAVNPRRLRTNIPVARGACVSTADVIEVRRSAGRLSLTVFPKALSTEPQGWLAKWAAELEAQRCIPAGAASHLAERIVQQIPLGLNSSIELLHPNDRLTGQVDIVRGMRLEVVSPILRAGAVEDAPLVTSTSPNSLTLTLSSRNIAGYERAWYVLRDLPADGGLSIAPEYAEAHAAGGVERRASPAENYFRFAPGASFYRLFYKSGENGYTAIVLAAHTLPELQKAAALIGDAGCDKLPEGACIAIPRRVAINPFVGVTVNGSVESVAWGGTVADAIRRAGEPRPAAVLSTLSVQKLYSGRPVPVEFDSHDPAILNLVLGGGEVISWNARPPMTH